MTQSTHITKKERYRIGELLREGKSHRAIADMLKRHHSSINEEVRLNSTNGEYHPKKAHAKARLRRRMSKVQVMKLSDDRELCRYVEEKLSLDWSPEEVAGRLRYVEKGRGRVSFKAIYKFIDTALGQHLRKYLRYRNRPKKSGPKQIQISNRTMIDKRPKCVEKRRVFGHWEADFIVSGKGGSGALLVLVERKTRYAIIRKLLARDTATVNAAITALLGGSLVAHSITLDNDISFQKHEELSRLTGAAVYFCHPYHSWEKGTVENMNKWVRQYVPKKTDISTLSDEFIAFVEARLNGRPRKCLKYKMPSEMLARERELQKTVCAMMETNLEAAVLRG